MRMTRTEELKIEVESKLNRAEEVYGEASYTIAVFESVHTQAKKIAKLGYTVTKTSENSYLIAR